MYAYDETVVRYAENVKRATGGRFELTPYPEGALVPSTGLLDAVKKGTLEMANIMAAYMSGSMPVTNLIYGYPATYRSFEDFQIHHKQFGFDDVLKKAFDEYGVVYLGDVADAGVILVGNKPVRKVDDLKGMKIRATGGAAEVLKELGASVVFMSGSELYTAISTGVIDGCIYGGPKTALADMKFGEIVKYVTMPLFMQAQGPLTYVVNKDKWNSLPDEYKAILEMEVRDRAGDFFPGVRYQDANVFNEWRQKSGHEVITLSDEEYNKIGLATRTVLTRFVAEKNDKYLTEGYKTLENFMKWRGYWK